VKHGWAILVLLTLALAAAAVFLALRPRPAPGDGASGRPGEPPEVSVCTLNLYLGADVTRVAGAATVQELASRVETFYVQALASDFPFRAQGIAEQIAHTTPDIVCLQEAALWRRQPQGDAATGNARATEVICDYLQVLLSALHARGRQYQLAAVGENGDFEFPTVHHGNVRYTDREAILAAPGLSVESARSGRFGAQLSFEIAGRTVRADRGWACAQVRVAGRLLQVYSVHLEAFGSARRQQGDELAELGGTGSVPTIVAGDFNADANTSQALRDMAAARAFLDAWSVLYPRNPGLTACQAEDLGNDLSLASQRLDVVFASAAHFQPLEAQLWNDRPFVSSHPTGRLIRWLSDHAGLNARLRLK
jgi:endonuclease/exonuclease/phosphatase family metal-dependent hydrolase